MSLFKRDSDPFALGRYGDLFRGGRARKRSRLRGRWSWLVLGLAGLLVGSAAAGAYLFNQLEDKVQTDIDPVDPVVEELDPFNVLLVGSDSRAGLTDEEQLNLGADAVEGERADTLILAHVDPRANTVVMVQFPRDLYVPIASGGSNKINSALEAGPINLVRTMEEVTGIDINNYGQVNIAGFRDLVNAIGGVDICIPEPIPFDPQTGIEITPEEVGMVHFDGERALRFVRSRNFPTGDFERIQNQQRFLSAAIDKVTSASTFFSPGRIARLYRAVGDNLVTDGNTGLLELKGIAERMQSFDPQTYEAYIVPNLGTATNEAGSVVLPDYDAMEVMFAAVAANESPAEADGVPDIDPATIRVGVYNGTAEEGEADAAAQAILQATSVGGKSVLIEEVANAGNFLYKQTVVEYEPHAELMAQLVAAALPGAELRPGRTNDGVDVAVIVGSRFRTQPIVQILPLPLPAPAELPPECRG